MAHRLSRIDDLSRPGHLYLEESDRCFFFKEYTAYGGFRYSLTNNLISNFKKTLDKKNKPKEWQYKEEAMETVAKMLRKPLERLRRHGFTSVPIPPSKRVFPDQGIF